MFDIYTLGSFILWYAWYAYTVSSSYGVSGGRWDINARTACMYFFADSSPAFMVQGTPQDNLILIFT